MLKECSLKRNCPFPPIECFDQHQPNFFKKNTCEEAKTLSFKFMNSMYIFKN